jgi:ABC-type Fe3+-hydroxamate transport system substrate-binding protein
MKTFQDQIGQFHRLDQTPKRIVCLVPSITELLYHLGLEDAVVGITKFCEHPVHFKKTKTIIGGTKQVYLEKIIALQPDIIIANKEENTQEIVVSLQKFAPVWVTNIVTVEDALQMVLDMGKLFQKNTEAQKWVLKIQHAREDFKKFIKNKPSKKVVYFIWAKPYMVAANQTFIHQMLLENGWINCYENLNRYPEIEVKQINLKCNPDLILLSSEPFPFKDKHAFEIGRFTQPAKTIFVDGSYFSWYGSRMYAAYGYFKQIHQRLEESFEETSTIKIT